MKVILGANISLNGRVLLQEDPRHQVPQQAVDVLMQIATQVGNLVIGRKTYDLIEQFPGGINENLPGMEIVLLSSGDGGGAGHVVVNSPEEAITYLHEKGFSEIAIGGGTQTYNAFLDKDLVTDVYINIIPIVTGNGGVLAANNDLVSNFKLEEHRPLTDGIVQLYLTRAR